jgi:hypothetical protein
VRERLNALSERLHERLEVVRFVRFAAGHARGAAGALMASQDGSPAKHAGSAAIKALTRLYYAGLLIGLSGASATLITDLVAPTPHEFQASIMRGQLSPASAEIQHAAVTPT